MPDPLILATVLALQIPGGTTWMQKHESLTDIEHLAEAVWHEARNKSYTAQTQVAFSVLDRSSYHSASASVGETLAKRAQYPWFEKRQGRLLKIERSPIEAYAWKQAVLISVMVYASDDKTPLLRRACPGNPTMFDDARNQRRLGLKRKGCVVDGIIFWEEV
jgi:hypothetical protein